MAACGGGANTGHLQSRGRAPYALARVQARRRYSWRRRDTAGASSIAGRAHRTTAEIAGRPRERLLRAFVPFACAYLIAHLLRSVTAVAGPEIRADLGLTPSELGLLTSAYFLGYGLMQVPVGVMLDRLGPRRTDAGLLLVGMLGAALFASADGVLRLGLGRLLIGVGFSAGLLAGYKANALWFPLERLPLMNGLLMACGGIGSTLSTAPAGLLMEGIGWRALFLLLAGLTALAAALIWLAAPERDPAAGDGGGQGGGAARVGDLAALGIILRDALFWRVMPLTVLAQAVWLAYISLWAGPWLAEVAGLAPLAVANHLLALSVGLAIGFFAQGAAAQALVRFGVPPLCTMAAGMIAFLLTQGVLATGLTALAIPGWFLFGLFGAVPIISYAVLAQHFPQAMVGRAMAVLNFLVFALAFAFQAGIGVLIEVAGGGAAGHLTALQVLVLLQAAGWAWLVWPRRRT